jgi:CelD/BcsL family acetyltransferase involved in cellulose biosynthesis
MKTRRIESLAEFEALGPAWAAVVRESGQTSPFLSHEWFRCCWRGAARARRIQTILVEDTTGKGHLSKAVDGKLRHCIFVPVD